MILPMKGSNCQRGAQAAPLSPQAYNHQHVGYDRQPEKICDCPLNHVLS